ncbi:MAG: methyltransferase [Rhodospirillales bacterium]|nr:methyltransferase [Rhodospirillales bacterium]
MTEATSHPEGDAQGITQDDLLGGRVRLSQPARGYRAAIDPVLLAAAVPARAGERVLDLGCGVGAAALCLLARVPGVEVTGLEIQNALVRLAAANAALNGLADRFEVLEGDVLAPPPSLAGGGFDRVMLNPPYLAEGTSRPPDRLSQALATHEADARLADWLDTALVLLKPKGGLTLVHRADRLDDVLSCLRGRAGGIRILPFWPAAGKPAKRVLVAARKAVAGPLTLAPGLVLHEADGRFTAAAEAVLRDAVALAL